MQILALIVLLTISACSPAEMDSRRCQSFGYQPGTVSYAACLQSYDQQRIQNQANYFATRPANQPYQVPFYPIETNRGQPSQTTCFQAGNQLNCFHQ